MWVLHNLLFCRNFYLPAKSNNSFVKHRFGFAASGHHIKAYVPGNLSRNSWFVGPGFCVHCSTWMYPLYKSNKNENKYKKNNNNIKAKQNIIERENIIL